MAERSPRTRAILALLSAHRELSAVELREAGDTLISSAVALAVAAFAALVGWGALNAAIVLAFGGHDPWKVAGAVAAANLVIAGIAGLCARRLLKRPFFEHTRREVARDSKQILEIVA